MQQAETVLNVIRERGERGLPLENIYRLLYNRNLYLRAYGRIYSNQGATTKGATAETMDGMSLAKIDRIIEALRYERFRWTPVRRVNIPKPNGTTRALGIPTGPDKLLQEVIRMILEAYYEPQFSDRSHGFRPDRGCHTALSNVTTYWTGTRWFVEGDIKGAMAGFSDPQVYLSLIAAVTGVTVVFWGGLHSLRRYRERTSLRMKPVGNSWREDTDDDKRRSRRWLDVELDFRRRKPYQVASFELHSSPLPLSYEHRVVMREFEPPPSPRPIRELSRRPDSES